jgi:hypothetical protein
MNRFRRIFRSQTRERLTDAEELIDFLADEIGNLKRELEQAVDALRTDVGDDLANLRDDLSTRNGGAS